MRLVLPPVGAPMPSLSWPQSSASLISAEPISGPASSLPCYKGCSLYEDGWSQRDNVPDLLISARPHSLMASREQCGGIEMLVDELCAKLKQIQDGDTEAPQSPRPNVALVLQDMHSHFVGPESLGGATEFADSWSTNCYYTDSWLQVNNNNKHSLPQEQQQKEEERATTFNIWQQPSSLIDGGDNTKDAELLRVLAENQQNTLNDDYDDENDLDLLLEPPSVNDDDRLACLIAKFDSTVEALWSPPESMILEDKSPLQIESQSFISSGTNLTSSIWSDTTVNDNKDQSFPSLLVETEKIVGDRGKWSEDAGDTKKEIKNAWNNIENTNTATTEEKSWQIGYGLGLLSQQILDGENESQQNSLNLINHHREKSGFTEVKKSINKISWSVSTDPIKLSLPAYETPSTEITQEEEDLLTSAKTHFRPIRQSVSQDAVSYEDGTTFAISSGLDEPPFQRSASGCLYLNGPGSPRKYMLYTEKEPFNGKYITDEGEGGGFVPKFAVLKTEKAIQTELDNEDSDIEEDKGVYFPEEEAGQFADNIDCPADIEDEGDSEQESEDSPSESSDGSEPKFGLLNCRTGGAPANVPTWSDAKWCGGAVSKAKSSWFHRLWREGSTEASKPSARLREELSAEGEQLIADIQFLQQLFLGDCWLGPQDELAQGLISPPEDNCSPPINSWCASERTYDEHNAAPRTMIARSTGAVPVSGWEYPGPAPPPPSSE